MLRIQIRKSFSIAVAQHGTGGIKREVTVGLMEFAEYEIKYCLVGIFGFIKALRVRVSVTSHKFLQKTFKSPDTFTKMTFRASNFANKSTSSPLENVL